MTKKPFRFGVATYGAETGAAWITKARKVEELGYSTLLVPDHFIEQIATIPALTAAALATTKLRVGSIVLCNDFRHPILMAKEAATIDFLSDGRFELGLGAGWMKAEYDATGIPFESPSIRVSRLEEAIKIIKGYWSDEPFTFSGRYYEVDETKGIEKIPRTVQRPYPPLLIGAGGRRMLSLAAREADIIGLTIRVRADGRGPDFNDIGVSLSQKVGWVKDVAGDRFEDIELNVLTWALVITDNREQAAAPLAKRFSLPEETVLSLPFLLIGSVDEIADDIESHREQYGISYYVIWDRDMEAFKPIVSRLKGR
jgi:probable F420-dependent oxidoreductase